VFLDPYRLNTDLDPRTRATALRIHILLFFCKFFYITVGTLHQSSSSKITSFLEVTIQLKSRFFNIFLLVDPDRIHTNNNESRRHKNVTLLGIRLQNTANDNLELVSQNSPLTSLAQVGISYFRHFWVLYWTRQD
jgi:hypothetical protein